MRTSNIESSLKRFLKRKIKVTLGLVVAFMITGAVGYAEELGKITQDKILIEDSTATQIHVNNGEIKITGNYELTLNGSGSGSGIYIGTSNNNSAGVSIDGDIAIKDFSTGINLGNKINLDIKGKTTIGGDENDYDVMYKAISTAGGAGTSVNFQGGLEVKNVISTNPLLHIQRLDFKSGFLNIENIKVEISYDQASPIQANQNTSINIKKDENLEGSGILSIKNIEFTKNKYHSFGIFLYGATLNADKVYINTLKSYGNDGLYGICSVGNGGQITEPGTPAKDLISYIAVNDIFIENLTGIGNGTDKKEISGIVLGDASLMAQEKGYKNNVFINNINSITENTSASGLHSEGDGDINQIMIDGSLQITNINSEKRKAIGADISKTVMKANDVKISKIVGNNIVKGMYIWNKSETTVNNLSIDDISVSDKNETVIGLDISNSNVTINNGIITTDIFNGNNNYIGNYKENLTNNFVDIKTIAIHSSNESSLKMDSADGIYHVYGNIVAKNSEVGKTGGNINIAGKETVIKGDVFALNGGNISLNLTGSDSFLEGQVDDFSELDTFHNSKFYDENGNELSVDSIGKISIKLNDGAKWNCFGQSHISDLENNGFIDMTQSKNSSIIAKNLSGNGTIKMMLDSKNKESSDMIYVTENFKGTQNIEINWSNLEGISAVDSENRLRFATTNGDTSTIEAYSDETGIFNIKYKTQTDNYDSKNDKDENIIYNGEGNGEDTYKPGNDFADKVFGDKGINHYIVGVEEQTKSDGGITIVEMAKANYASAVYMDNLNKRLGDMSFVEGNEGLWVRMRNDRVGEDSEYRLRNYMTQIGYDKTYDLDDGKEYRGIALDYTQGEMEYKNIHGESNIDRYTFTAYDTRVYNSGAYADYVARAGYMESDFEIYGRQTGNKAEGDFDNLYFGLSAEFGKRYNFGEEERSYFEPQVQLQYTYIDDTDYTTNQNTKVDYDNIHSLIGRAGFRLGHDFYKENSKDNTIYLKADINHEFLGDQDVSAMDLTGKLDETYHNDGTWYDVGIGGAKNLSENLYVYADVERQFGTGKDNSWQFNLGFRYKFGTLEDFTLTNLFDFDKSEIKPEGRARNRRVEIKYQGK